ncbi:MAG: TetR/AcrR family transcriptional regulator [Leptospiraceae bacterium]|nr:TetR/AcrR family transcriptional regulator [Leptospiraceae bacterium]MDW7975648.1 TetR/AcrR family transcriptional regulator [Leptospiraceae bacterium]
MKVKKPTKEIIIEAAYKEFAEKGFDGARMQKIAERAKINKAMLHYYYHDKQTLYENVIEYFHSLFDRILQEKSVETKDRITFLEQIVDAYYKIYFEYPEVKKIFIHELASGFEATKKLLKKHDPDHVEKIAEKFFLLTKIKELQDHQEIRMDIEPEHIMMTILGLIESSLVQLQIVSKVLDYDQNEVQMFLEKRKESIVKILDQGLAIRNSP